MRTTALRSVGGRAPARACALALLATAAAGSLPARAQVPAASAPTPRVGQKLKDARGAVAGQIEKVILAPDGRPLQVLVRVARVLRALPVDSLTPSGDGYATVLSRAELEALPAAG